MAHPLPWTPHLDPDTIASGSVDVIAEGAVTVGAIGDAVVAWDHAEQARRQRVGLGAVTSLWLLDAVMTLPAGTPVRVTDLSEGVRACICTAPRGVVAIDGKWVVRLLSPPLTVVGAVVCGTGWRRLLQRVGRFTPFAQRLLVLEKTPPSRVRWEAQVAGVGVWTFKGAQLTEICPPEPFKQLYWKPAGWRFAERAYAASLRPNRLPGWSPACMDRPAHTSVARSGPRQLALPLT